MKRKCFEVCVLHGREIKFLKAVLFSFHSSCIKLFQLSALYALLDKSWVLENLYLLLCLEECGLSCLLFCKSLHQSRICSNRTAEGCILTSFVMT